jgi:hypothetical protein
MQNPTSLEEINHFIDKEEARKLISTFQEMKYELVNPKYDRFQKEYGVLPTSEAFNDKSILAVLAQPGCVGVRIHYGIKKELRDGEEVPLMVAVIVGVRKDGSNMWSSVAITKPASQETTTRSADGDGVILEDSQRCPPFGDSDPIS